MTMTQHINANRKAKEKELKEIVRKYNPKSFEELKQIQHKIEQEKRG